MIKDLLVDYTRYNLWVNTQLIELFKNVDEALISQHVESSFPSIRATLIHLWDVEKLWLARLRGMSPTKFPSENFEGSNTEVYDSLLATSKEFLEFVNNQTEEFLNADISFTLLSAKGEFQQKAADMIHHCMNHQTFHRGQIVTMARQVGITQFPRMDYIIFKRLEM